MKAARLAILVTTLALQAAYAARYLKVRSTAETQVEPDASAQDAGVADGGAP